MEELEMKSRTRAGTFERKAKRYNIDSIGKSKHSTNRNSSKIPPIIFKVKPKFSNNLLFTPYHTSDLLSYSVSQAQASGTLPSQGLHQLCLLPQPPIPRSLCFTPLSPSPCAQRRPILVTLFKTGTLTAKLVFLTLLSVFISRSLSKTSFNFVTYHVHSLLSVSVQWNMSSMRSGTLYCKGLEQHLHIEDAL